MNFLVIGIGLLVNTQQVARLFVNRGFIIGTFSTVNQVSSLWPQAWDLLTLKNILTLQEIYLIWIGLTLSSLLIGTFVLPWFNIEEGQSPLSLPQLLETVYNMKLLW